MGNITQPKDQPSQRSSDEAFAAIAVQPNLERIIPPAGTGAIYLEGIYDRVFTLDSVYVALHAFKPYLTPHPNPNPNLALFSPHPYIVWCGADECPALRGLNQSSRQVQIVAGDYPSDAG